MEYNFGSIRNFATVSLIFILSGCLEATASVSKNPLQPKIDAIARENSVVLADIIVNKIWNQPVQKNWKANSQDRFYITSDKLVAVRKDVDEETNCGFDGGQFSNGGRVSVTTSSKRSAPDTFDAKAAELKRTYGEAAAKSKIAQLRSESKVYRMNLAIGSSKCGVSGKTLIFMENSQLIEFIW